jgi:hypothetical protein
MSANRLMRFMIGSVNPKYNADYIANVFWRKDIGKVSSITLIPQIVDSEVLNTAYITFSSFCASETARDFVSRFNGIRGVFIFYHAHPEHDNVWLLEPNTHYYGELCVGEYTTKFTDDFFSSYSSSESTEPYSVDKLQDPDSGIEESHGEETGNGSVPLSDLLINCTPFMERQIAMTEQEIDDLLEHKLNII